MFNLKGIKKLQSDEELYLQLKSERKKEFAFRSLYDRHSGPLFRFIYRFTVNQQVAEEILHDIFIQVLNEKYNSQSEGSLKSWLYTVAKNKSLNSIKKASFEKKEQVEVNNAVCGSNLEESFISDNLLKRLSTVEKELPLDLQQTWNLKKQGLDYQQISQKLSIPVGTVKSRFSRLVDHLKKEFQL